MIDGSCKKVINEASCGICVSAGDIKGFSDAIVKFSMEKDKWAEYGINSKNYFLKHFRKDIHVKAIEEELKRCIKDV